MMTAHARLYRSVPAPEGRSFIRPSMRYDVPLPIELKKTIITSGILLKVLIGSPLGKPESVKRKEERGKGDHDGETISAWSVSVSIYIYV